MNGSASGARTRPGSAAPRLASKTIETESLTRLARRGFESQFFAAMELKKKRYLLRFCALTTGSRDRGLTVTCFASKLRQRGFESRF